MAASEDERLAVEDAALGIVSKVESHSIRGTLVVGVPESFLSDRDEFGFIVLSICLYYITEFLIQIIR